jgi:hypothetical protein
MTPTGGLTVSTPSFSSACLKSSVLDVYNMYCCISPILDHVIARCRALSSPWPGTDMRG